MHWVAGSAARTRRGRREFGIALVMVLWVLMLLAVIAASLTRDTRSQLNIAGNLLESARAEAAADGGIHRAIAALLTPAGRDGIRVDGTVYAWRFEGADVRIRIWDEGGKIDLNAADETLLADLFMAAGVEAEAAQALADRIADYRDRDDLVRLNGAEDDDYARAGLAHGAKDAPFAAIEELHLILGMTPEIYTRVADEITVHTRSRVPDRRFARALVRMALPGPAAQADDGDTGDAPTGQQTPGPVEAPADGSLRVIAQGAALGRSRANAFAIHSEARTEAGAVFSREALVRLAQRRQGRDRYRILLWRQGKRELFDVPRRRP